MVHFKYGFNGNDAVGDWEIVLCVIGRKRVHVYRE